MPSFLELKHRYPGDTSRLSVAHKSAQHKQRHLRAFFEAGVLSTAAELILQCSNSSSSGLPQADDHQLYAATERQLYLKSRSTCAF